MSMIERLFTLRRSPAFSQLRDTELVLIAASARTRRYTAGEIIGAAGRPLRHLFVVVDGEAVTASGRELPGTFGAISLLFGSPLDEAVRAGDTGLVCLIIRRAHFHTILNECPGLVVGLLQAGASAEPARAA